MITELDNRDKKLLSLLQLEFPLTREPYADLGLKLGISGDEVINRISRLKKNRIVRQISPVLDARKLGFQSALVAIKIPEDSLVKAEKFIIQHPGVSHGYKRNHEFNVWITLSMPLNASSQTELNHIASSTGAEAIFALPALKVFKLRTHFDMDANGDTYSEATGVKGAGLPSPKEELSPTDRQIINELQQDLPLVSAPFNLLAAKLGVELDNFLSHCRFLLERDIIRRYGASISHRKAGYKANVMACWVVSPSMVDAVGSRLAKFRQVSHCYERKTNALWRYNLFAMIHGDTRDNCRQLIGKVSNETGLADYVTLFSTREIKKVRIKYQV